MVIKKLSALEKLAGRAAPVVDDAGKAVAIPLDKIRFDPTQPRQSFHHPDGRVSDDDEKSVDELAESIREQGLIHPITVEPTGDGTYRVVVGERRTRAHLKLGLTTILAKVRDDLTSTKKRLVYQLAENVNREDLTDADMARSIRNLMEGGNGEESLNQSQIAKALGKSEGWVSRYVKYGDEELQRLWVQTGIADTVEKLYRLSVLPMPVQADVQRRVLLPEDHPDHLPKPLGRTTIDDMARAAKIAKGNTPNVNRPGAADTSPLPPHPGGAPSLTIVSTSNAHAATEGDPVAAHLARMVQEGRESGGQSAGQVPTGSGGATINSPKYELAAEHRAAILGAANVVVEGSQKAVAQPPISVRVPMGCLQKVLEKLLPEDRPLLEAVQLSVNLPGPLAGRIANALVGMVVDPREVPAVVQTELAKLQ